ncbi:helix-turn-helix domain-containing protein [uncultured Robinsoniella sp.]|uniref:helix-turn-helix domain-containing protein n=2 Tax=uncultured Robinsoniella sp. TaxID=904190 RepID=UPI00374F34A8
MTVCLKESTGQNFQNYTFGLRMEEGIRLLLNTPASISEISSVLGYSETVSFMKAFKTYTGLTPSQYRINNENS